MGVCHEKTPMVLLKYKSSLDLYWTNLDLYFLQHRNWLCLTSFNNRLKYCIQKTNMHFFNFIFCSDKTDSFWRNWSYTIILSHSCNDVNTCCYLKLNGFNIFRIFPTPQTPVLPLQSKIGYNIIKVICSDKIFSRKLDVNGALNRKCHLSCCCIKYEIWKKKQKKTKKHNLILKTKSWYTVLRFISNTCLLCNQSLSAWSVTGCQVCFWHQHAGKVEP